MSLQAVGIVSTWTNVTTTEIAIGFHLANCQNAETGKCYPSIAYLANKCGMQDRGIQKALSKMELKGLIERRYSHNSHGKQQTTRYVFNPVPQDTRTPVPKDAPLPVPQDTQNQEEGNIKKIPKKKQDIPDDIGKELWAEWMDVRKKKKAVNSPTAIKALLTNLDKCVKAGYTRKQAVEMAVTESWKSVNPEWMKNKLQQSSFAKPKVVSLYDKQFPSGMQDMRT